MKQGKYLISMASLLGATLSLTSVGSAQTTVYSNNVGGDAFSVQGPFGVTTRFGQAVGSSGWYYNNVGTLSGGTGGGTAGIDSVQARSGTGSGHLQVNGGGKADIEYYGAASQHNSASDTTFYGAFGSGAVSLGKLSALSSLSYDWMRGSADTGSVAAPSIRLSLYDNAAAPTKFGYIVFEPYENGYSTIPNMVWQTNDVVASNLVGWETGNLPGHSQSNVQSLTYWQGAGGLSTYDVVGISVGVGSSNGTMDAYVDNVRFGFGGVNTTYNFESQAVPEPCSMIGLALGAVALVQRKLSK